MEEVKREYKMTDAELMMFVSNLALSMNRDATQFVNYTAADHKAPLSSRFHKNSN